MNDQNSNELAKPETLAKPATGKKRTSKRKRNAADALAMNNVIFVGKRELKGKAVDAVPPLFIRDGRELITLPTAEGQLKGFFHKDAARIIRAMPKLYKAFVKKGAK